MVDVGLADFVDGAEFFHATAAESPDGNGGRHLRLAATGGC